MKYKIFSAFIATTRLQSHERCLFSGWTKRLTEKPRAPLDAELNAVYNHGVRMRTAWQQKKEKLKKRFFQHLSVPLAYSSHEHCLFSGWTKRLTEMPRTPLDAALNALFNRGVRMRPASPQKKKIKKKNFSLYRSTSHLKIPRKLPFFGWTKRLREMPSAPLDAELNALFNRGVRMGPAWQQKKKN